MGVRDGGSGKEFTGINQKKKDVLLWAYNEETRRISRERNYARNGTGSKSKRETKEEMDGQCGRMVGIINRKVAAGNRGQEKMEKNRLQCDQPSYRGRSKRERERWSCSNNKRSAG